jgi:hypothetical protein
LPDNAKIRYQKSQFDCLQKSLAYLKPLLENRTSFLLHFGEIYQLKGKSVKKQMRLYAKLLRAVNDLQDIEFRSGQIVSRPEPIKMAKPLAVCKQKRA